MSLLPYRPNSFTREGREYIELQERHRRTVKRLAAWRDWAQHLEHCRACSEDSQPCEVGNPLKQATRAVEELSARPRGGPGTCTEDW